jgi:hypothetical protein
LVDCSILRRGLTTAIVAESWKGVSRFERRYSLLLSMCKLKNRDAVDSEDDEKAPVLGRPPPLARRSSRHLGEAFL